MPLAAGFQVCSLCLHVLFDLSFRQPLGYSFYLFSVLNNSFQSTLFLDKIGNLIIIVHILNKDSSINDSLNEREFELINIIGAEMKANQRELSHHMDLSLGLTNMLIRRLIAKGYIRMRQLNKKKMEYILTSKGFAEKMRKSVKYTLKTINSIGFINAQLKHLILELYQKGERIFFLYGESDLVTLIEMVFKESQLYDCKVSRMKDIPKQKMEGIIFICTEKIGNGFLPSSRHINVINELAKKNNFSSRNNADRTVE